MSAHGATARSTSGDPLTLRLREPGDLLEAVPYLVGFHPADSLVLIALADGRVAVTLRMDLADAEDGPAVLATIPVLARADADAVIVVVYQDSPLPPGRSGSGQALPREPLAARTAACFRSAGFPVLDALLVCAGRWWSYVGWEDGCQCCATGQQLPGSASATAASAVFAGLAVAPNRQALEDALDPDAGRERLVPGIWACEDALLQAALDGQQGRHHRSVKRALFSAAREADSSLVPRAALSIADSVLCRFAAGLAEYAVRDPLWLAVDQGRLDGRGLWQVLLRALPSPHDCAPLFLFGWANWREGNGALASMAAERALASDPGYRAADLLLSAIRQGLDPFRTPRLRVPARRLSEPGRRSAG